MPIVKPVIVLAAALFFGNAFAAPPAYDGQTPMIEAGPLWLDPAMTGEEQASVTRSLVQAQANILAAYGKQRASPRVVWCKTMDCVAFFSGTDRRSFANVGNGRPRAGAQYGFPFPALVITRQALYPGNIRATEVLTHEISHIELAARLGGASIPAWFDEGVATYLEQPKHCRPGTRGIDNLFTLQNSKQWMDYTNQGGAKYGPTYCQASNEVGAWIAEHGDFSAVLQLLARRERGKPFNALYGRIHELLAPPDSPSTVRGAGVDSTN